jgi:hypothetical protein
MEKNFTLITVTFTIKEWNLLNKKSQMWLQEFAEYYPHILKLIIE